MNKLDVEIVLVDKNEKITMNVDKYVLESFQYFHNLFNFGMEKN